jgi:hypothetical protein
MTTTAFSGVFAGAAVPPSGSVASYTVLQTLPITAGDTLSVTGHVSRSNPSDTVYLYIDFLTGILTTPKADSIWQFPNPTKPAWVTQTLRSIAPTSAISVRIGIYVLPQSPGNLVLLDAFALSVTDGEPTPTPSFTKTATSTQTGTATRTATATNTAIATRTSTPTHTATASRTPTGGAPPDQTQGPPPVPPNPGDVLISVVFSDPAASPEPGREWIELYNPREFPVTLAGCTLVDGAAASTIPVATVPAGGWLVIAASPQFLADTPGFTGSVVFFKEGRVGNGLRNAGDHLSLMCGGIAVDSMSYGDDASVFNPPPPAPASGKSLERPFGVVLSGNVDPFIVFSDPSPGGPPLQSRNRVYFPTMRRL